MFLREWLKPTSGALNTLFAPHYFASDDLVLTKRNDLFAVYQHPGIDFECKTDEELESVSKNLHTATRNLNGSFRIYRYAIKRKGVNIAYHRAKELYSFSFYLVLLHEAKPNTASDLAVKRLELDARISEIEDQLASFETSAKAFLPLTRLAVTDIGGFLGKLTETDYVPRYSDHIDYWMAQAPIIVNEKDLFIASPVRTMTLRQLPRETSPNLFSALLKLPCNLILCDEFKRVANDKAISMLEAAEDHFLYRKDNRNAKDAARNAKKKVQNGTQSTVKDTVADENLTECGELKKRIANHGEFLGEYSMTLVLSGDNIGRAAAEASNIVGNAEGSLLADGTGSLDSYLSIIPGNTQRNLRKLWNLSANYADLAPIYGPAVGSARNEHLGGDALAVLETNLLTPYYFNAHESDLLGVLIFGIMGSGKSFLTNLIADKSQQYRPFSFILDIGGSYKHLALEHGGTFISLARRKNDFTMNPFACEKTEDNLDFLAAFVHILLDTSGYEPTAVECQLIDQAVKTATRLSELDLPKDLMDHLYNWCGSGRFAYLFDNEFDTLTLDRLVAFDFQGVRKQLLEPLFFYIFNKISQIVYDQANIDRPKELICDEVWKLLKNETARDYIVEAGKTFRKHNGGIILTTQSALDMEKVGLLEVISEICPTKILLANPGSNKAHYASLFELNSTEVELFSGLTSKKQALVKTPLRSVVVNIMPTQEEVWRWSNDPRSNIKRNQLIAEHGYEKAKTMELLKKGAAA